MTDKRFDALRPYHRAISTAVLVLLGVVPAAALAPRTFVSSKGADTNVCSVVAPCRTYQKAVDQTAAGGEVITLDGAGYGAVTIGKSISIVNDGIGTAVIGAPGSGSAITINAATDDNVHLRGLEIDGQSIQGGQGTSGITLNSGNLHVAHCRITRVTNFGIALKDFGKHAKVAVVNSTLSGTFRGIQADGAASLVVEGSSFGNFPTDIFNSGVSSVVIGNSVFDRYTTGVITSGGKTFVYRSKFSNKSGDSVSTIGSGATYVGRSAIIGNGKGIAGDYFSYGTNEIDANINGNTDGTRTLKPTR